MHLLFFLDEELPAENIWEPARVQRFVEDDEYTGETWVVNQEVVCSHELICVEEANIIQGKDTHSEMYEVTTLNWIPIRQIPEHM